MEHRLITGGYEYLPLAQAWVTKLKKLGLPYADQSFRIGGAQIRIRIEPGHEYIVITAGAGNYEFFTSDKWFVPPYFGTLGASYGGNQAIQYGCGTLVSKGTPSPLFANTLDGSGAWPLVPYATMATSQTREKTGMFWLKYAANNQRLNPTTWWVGNDSRQIVTSTNTWGKGRTWNSNRYRAYNWSRVMLSAASAHGEWHYPFIYLRPAAVYYESSLTWTTRDSFKRVCPLPLHEAPGMFDVVPTLYNSSGVATAGHKRTTQSNWRRAAMVSANNGERFCVSTDTHGVFTFYKLQGYPFADEMWGTIPDPYDLPDEMVKVVRVEYPTWVTVTPDGTSTTDDHWQWSFNKTGAKAAGTPLNKQQAAAYVRHYREFDVPSGRWVWTVFYSVDDTDMSVLDRVQVPLYMPTDPIANPGLPAVVFSLGGSLVMLYDGGFYQAYYEDVGISSISVANPELYSPMYEITPGFIEVAIAVTVDPDTGEFTPTVTVTDSEEYFASGVFYIDTEYYVRTPRTTPKGDVWAGDGYSLFEPEDDDLLTAEIEVKYQTDNYNATYPVGYYTSISGVAAAGLDVSGLYVNLVIKRRSDRATVKRLCLAHDVKFTNTCVNYADYFLNAADPGSTLDDIYHTYHKSMVGMIEQMDLRYLSFLTKSHARKKCVLHLSATIPDGYTDINGTVTNVTRRQLSIGYIKPRFELRVHGESIKTIDYSEAHLTGFSAAEDDVAETYGPDPMTTHTSVPVTSTDLSMDATRKFIPLYLKQYFAGICVFPVHIDFMSFNPEGSWSVYVDRRGLPPIAPGAESITINGTMTIKAASTEQSGVFDIIAPVKDKRTTHRAAFNTAFKQARGYSDYESGAATSDFGGFATHGIWY